MDTHGSVPDNLLKGLESAADRVSLPAASDTLALKTPPVSTVGAIESEFTGSELTETQKILFEDCLTCVGILGVASATSSASRASASRALLKDVVLKKNLDYFSRTLALKLLLETRSALGAVEAGPVRLLQKEFGELFSVFFESPDDGSNSVEADEGDAHFFESGSTVLLEVVVELLRQCPNDDRAVVAQFEAVLHVSEVTVEEDESGGDMTLPRFLNGALTSRHLSVRFLAYEAVATAAAKAPSVLGSAAVNLFARATGFDSSSAGWNGVQFQKASFGLGWALVGKTGPSSLVDALPELADCLYQCSEDSAIWRRSVATALGCLDWDDAAVEHRGEIALALVLAHVQSIPRPTLTVVGIKSGRGKIQERLIASCSRGAQRHGGTAEALSAASQRAVSLILDDSQFNLEEILCGTGMATIYFFDVVPCCCCKFTLSFRILSNILLVVNCSPLLRASRCNRNNHSSTQSSLRKTAQSW